MKKLFLLIAISFSSMHLLSQSISIELSIHWKRDTLAFILTEKDFCVPYLHITYRNSSNEAMYFLKVSQEPDNISAFCENGYKVDKIIPRYDDYSKMHHIVDIDVSTHYLGYWMATPDTLYTCEELGIPIINYNLDDIYRPLFDRYIDTLSKIKLYYSISDIQPEVIFDKFKDKFVFLMPGEAYVDTYNLIGFMLLKGTYTFHMFPESLAEYVYTTPIWDSIQQRFIPVKTMLPKSVAGYKLYSGSFNTNKVTITFF